MRTLKANLAGGIPDSVFELAQNADEINIKTVKKKQLFNVAVIVVAIGILVLVTWLVSQGYVISEPGKRFAAFTALAAAALCIVGHLAQFALTTSVTAYQQLKILTQEGEKQESTDEVLKLIQAVQDAISATFTEESARKKFLDRMSKSERIKDDPALREMLKESLI